MATYTSHLNLKLPDYSDTADINDLNDNFKKIDDAISSGGTGGGTGGGIVTETDPTVPSWAKQPSKPTYTAAEVGALPDTTVIPTVPSALPNPQPIVINGISYDGSEKKEITVSAGDGGSITETDPTVPAWAKAEKKPSYTAEEVGALPSTYEPPVTSVNGKTGAVALVASDVGALPNTTVIPTVPTALKNPYPLTINGVEYDGSEAKTVTIESTGGGASVELDTTLTQYNKAADAGAVGNAIAQETAAREAAVNSLNEAIDAQGEGENLNLFYGAMIRRKANRNEPVNIEMTYAGGQNQPTHPSVLYIADGWNGHRWWMAYSPYPYSNDDYENPCIAYSDDGLNWIEDGISNPIDPMPSSGYNSDPDIVIVNGVMECWWRQVDGSNHEIIKRRKSSDGLNWSASEILHQTVTTNATTCLSPSVLYDDGKYKIWTVRQRIYVDYYESTDGTNWQRIREIATLSPIEDYKIWHLDVTKTNLGYELTASYQLGDNFDTNHYIAWSHSTDNVHYSNPICVLGRGNSGNFDSLELYRPSLVWIGRKYRMYYGAQKSGRVWAIGVVETPEMPLLNEILTQHDTDVPVYVPPAEIIPCTGITLDQTTLTFTEAGAQTLTATVTPNNTTDAVTWVSGDPSIASVIGGIVTAKANGNVTITATCGTYSATCEVNISGINVGDNDNGNIMSGVTWSVGTFNGVDGSWIDTTTDYATDMFDISEYAGELLQLKATGTPSRFCVKLGYWDASGSFISATYKEAPENVLNAVVPTNAVSARASVYNNMTDYAINAADKSVDTGFNNAEIFDDQAFLEGEKTPVSENRIACKAIDVSAGEQYLFINAASVWFYNAEGKSIEGLSYAQGKINRFAYAPENAVSVGVNWDKNYNSTADVHVYVCKQIGYSEVYVN